MSNDLQQAIAAIKAGDKKSGQQLLAQVVNADPQNEAAWLWMASTLDDPQEKKECLQKVLQINPNNETANEALTQLEPPELIELPRFGDISPKPAQKTAPSTGLAGSRLWRLSLFALGGVAVLLVLCIGAMLVGSSAVGRAALVSVFGPSNPPVQAIADEAWTRPTDGMAMMYVPAGEFTMGSTVPEAEYAFQICNEIRDGCDRAWFEREQPPHPGSHTSSVHLCKRNRKHSASHSVTAQAVGQ